MGLKLFQTNFTAGEWSPKLFARTDLAKYANACKSLSNCLIDPRGSAILRPGLRFIAETKTSAKESRVVKFEFSTTQAYILEFGDQYIRFYRNQGQIVDGGPVEISSPYLEADLFQLDVRTQSADVLYITHPSYEPRKLSRTSNTDWTLTEINFRPPPFAEQAIQPSATLTLAAVTGEGITFTAGSSVFLSGDVDRVITSGVGRAIITAVVAGDDVTCDIIDDFAAVGPIASGSWSLGGSPGDTLTPNKTKKGAIVTLTASLLDVFRTADIGKYVVIHSGLVKITTLTSAKIVTGEILKELAASTGTTAWTLEAEVWSSALGFPGSVTFFEERLFFAGSPSFPQTLWGSVTGDYENFTLGADDADALSYTIGSRSVNVIRWMVPQNFLMLGTVGGEFRVGSSDLNSPITPTNINVKIQTGRGSADVQPVAIDQSVLFLQKASRKINELVFNFESDGFVAPDLTLLAEHITKTGIKEMAYQQEPFSVVWCVRNDGTLLGLTYLRSQDVIGWHRHSTDGNIESVAVIPGDGYDEVWVVVKRTIDGSTVRYVEMMEEVLDFDSGTAEDAFFVDSGLTYDGVATTTITGLSHLEGEEVSILANGATHPPRTVSGGEITLDRSTTKAHVGLGYTGQGQTLNLEAILQTGSSQGATKRIVKATVRLFRSLGVKVGFDAAKLETIPWRNTGDPMDSPPPLFTGDKTIDFPKGWDTDAFVMFQQDLPLPMTVLGVIPDTEVRSK